jgi:hypothetical protein
VKIVSQFRRIIGIPFFEGFGRHFCYCQKQPSRIQFPEYGHKLMVKNTQEPVWGEAKDFSLILPRISVSIFLNAGGAQASQSVAVYRCLPG